MKPDESETWFILLKDYTHSEFIVHAHRVEIIKSTYVVCKAIDICVQIHTYLSVIVGDSIIQQSSKVRNLGIIFDQFLSFDDYISSVCRSTHFHLRNIGRIRHLLSQNATAQLIHALISIRLDYCNSILYNLPKNSILRLQRIQNQAARILTKMLRCDHITEVLINLHGLRIEERIVYKLLILMFKAFIDRTAPL